ncbi:hypothetical protein OUZ56_027883 [Daphnia magna]|uniref:Uncharacterized protein n=1 Tax=Daphnia magna TaxID=35525 RepID=A0ABR0B276_9CRUS|nr:hypothetical protein OUZ56_027883 [Daphnia magna]
MEPTRPAFDRSWRHRSLQLLRLPENGQLGIEFFLLCDQSLRYKTRPGAVLYRDFYVHKKKERKKRSPFQKSLQSTDNEKEIANSM